MNVLLSIKPRFAERILNRDKQYEFRKTTFRDPSSVESVLMYSSAPVQEIVGTFTLETVIEDRPEALWDEFRSKSGIKDRSTFFDYFSDTDLGYALKIDRVNRFEPSIEPRNYVSNFRPPVSFQYVNGEYDLAIKRQSVGPGSD